MYANEQTSNDSICGAEISQSIDQQSVCLSPSLSSSSSSSSAYNYASWYQPYYNTTSSPYNYYNSSYFYSNADSYPAYTSTYSAGISPSICSDNNSSSLSQNFVNSDYPTWSTSSYYDANSAVSEPVPAIATNSYPTYSTPADSQLYTKECPRRVEEVETEQQQDEESMPQTARMSRKHQLPERAVDIMNEWFDEHQHNPYPQLCEKERMAQLGGITVKQVTAWFSNRRNRSQNTKPKRIKRDLESKLNEICHELAFNPDSAQLAEKFKHIRSALESRY